MDTQERGLLRRISIRRGVCGGRPCIRGHRLPVELILDYLASGITPRELCSERYYPTIRLKDVLACIAYANQFVKNGKLAAARR